MHGELARTRGLVEEVLGALGVDPKVALAKDEPASVTWTLQRGSASIVITLAVHEGGRKGEPRTYLRVVSPVLTLDPKVPHETLFRHLLELNAAGLANAAFGVIDQRVVAVSERPTEDLQKNEVEQMVRHLAAVADTYDDRLRQRFGAAHALATP